MHPETVWMERESCFQSKRWTWKISCQWEQTTCSVTCISSLFLPPPALWSGEGFCVFRRQEIQFCALFFRKSLHIVRNLPCIFQAHLNLRIRSFDSSGTILQWYVLGWAGTSVKKPLSASTCQLQVPFVNIWLFEDRTLFLHLYSSEHILPWWKRAAYTRYLKQVDFWKHSNSCSNKQTGKQTNPHQVNPESWICPEYNISRWFAHCWDF